MHKSNRRLIVVRQCERNIKSCTKVSACMKTISYFFHNRCAPRGWADGYCEELS